MPNIGEELVGAYFKVCLNCKFVDYNIHTDDVQGEIDVIAIDFENKKIYICEVATHAITGLQYVKDKKSDNVNKLIEKFDKNIRYGKNFYNDFEQHYMLWSPIVKHVKKANAKWDQIKDIEAIRKHVRSKHDIDLEVVVNQDYLDKINALRKFASKETKESKLNVVRLFQIEERVKQYVEILRKRKK